MPDYRLLNRSALTASLITILIITPLPLEYTPDTGFSNKINFATTFMLLSIIACYEYNRHYLGITADLLICGLLIEIAQLWIPGRSYSMLNLAANLFGISA